MLLIEPSLNGASSNKDVISHELQQFKVQLNEVADFSCYLVCPGGRDGPMAGRDFLSLSAEDIRVTTIQHSHGRAAEQLSARSAKFNLYRN